MPETRPRADCYAAAIAAAIAYDGSDDPGTRQVRELADREGFGAVLKKFCGLEVDAELSRLVLHAYEARKRMSSTMEHREMKRFAGKRVLITGASQGIGRACAELFCGEGAEVIGSYVGDDDAARKAETALRAAGGKATLIRSDLGEPADVDELWKRANQSGGIDILILNAAFEKKATVDETDLALMEQTFRVNVFGSFQLSKLFLQARRPGAIVVHSSNQAEFVNPTGFAYALSKAALNHLVRHLALAGVNDGVRVNGVVLGWFDTEGERKFYSAEKIKKRTRRKRIPMGRAGDPKEAARMTAFLASDDASYMTGSLVRFDGGFALRPDLST